MNFAIKTETGLFYSLLMSGKKIISTSNIYETYKGAFKNICAQLGNLKVTIPVKVIDEVKEQTYTMRFSGLKNKFHVYNFKKLKKRTAK